MGTATVPVNVDDRSTVVQEDGLMVKLKLSNMTLRKFKGKITEFRGFWDRFEVAVHNNPSFLMIYD